MVDGMMRGAASVQVESEANSMSAAIQRGLRTPAEQNEDSGNHDGGITEPTRRKHHAIVLYLSFGRAAPGDDTEPYRNDLDIEVEALDMDAPTVKLTSAPR